MRVSITIPHRARPVVTDPNVCDCKKEPVLMTYKQAVIYWNVSEGDCVQEKDLIAEGEIEKQNIMIEAPASGILSEILIPDGEQAGVDTILGYIDSHS